MGIGVEGDVGDGIAATGEKVVFGQVFLHDFERLVPAFRAFGELVAMGIEEEPSSKAQARTYGMRMISYFPYLKLGIAYYHLGQTEAALGAFETEVNQGAIQNSDEHLAELERYRELIEREQADAEFERQRRAAEVITTNLAGAVELESEGNLDGALTALTRILSVDPDNAEALASQARILQVAADARLREVLEDQRSRLLERGRNELEAGDYRRAATTFNTVLENGPDAEVQAQFDEARAGLRRQFEEKSEKQRQELIDTGLSKAVADQITGDWDAALHELQTVLALAPEHQGAKTLEQNVLRTRSAAEAADRRRFKVSSLLADVSDLLANREWSSAVTRANRVLALARPSHQSSSRGPRDVLHSWDFLVLTAAGILPVC